MLVDAPGFRAASKIVHARAGAGSLDVVLQPAELPVIGSVTGTPRSPFNATALTQRVFPREAYRDQAQPAAASVLDQTPGALTLRDVAVNAGAPMAPAFASVRGGLPFETPVLLDGAPASLPSSRTFDVSMIPTFVLNDVEIVKGAGDVSGSGGGVGGAINLRTATPTATLRALPEIEGDSQGGQFSDVSYGGTLPGGKFSFASMFSIDASPGATAGTSFPIEGRCCAAVAGDALRRGLLIDLRDDPSAQWEAGATMLAVNLDRALAAEDGVQLGWNAGSLAPSLDAREADRFRFEQLRLRYAPGSETFDANAYGFELARDGDSSVAATSARDARAGGTLSWTHAIAGNRYSLQLSADRGSAEGSPFGQTPILSGSSIRSVRLRASAALAPSPRDRIELAYETNWLDAAFSPDGTHLVSRAWAPASARIGYARTVLPQFALRASWGTAAVPPPLAALSGSLPQLQQYVGFPARVLQSRSSVQGVERAAGVDVGLDWRLHGGTTTVTAGVYWNSTAGAYVQSSLPTGNGVAAVWFEGPAMIEDGLEAAIVQFKPVGLGYVLQLALPRTYVRGPVPASLYAGGNLAILPGQNVAGGAFFVAGENDVAPVRIPYAQGYAELSYKWPRGSRASIGALYLGANNAYGSGGFATLNANLEISAGNRGKLQFSVENLTDALDRPLPLAYGGIGVPLANGSVGPSNANALSPRTLRFMYRQSFGGGSIFER